MAPAVYCDPPEGSIIEKRPSVTDYHSRCAKPWKDNLMEHLTGMLCICRSAWHGFDPFGDVDYGNQDILASLGSYKRSHVVNTPNVKKFNLKIAVQGHCVASCDPSMPLAIWTSSDEVSSVFIHRWPIEPTLLDFRLSVKYTILTSIWCFMAFFYDLASFGRRYTMSEKPICTYSVQIWCIP